MPPTTHTEPKIVAAAIKYYGVVLSVPRPQRHGDILNWLAASGLQHSGETADRVHGFLLSDGTFVDRYEGFNVAVAAGQYRTDLAKGREYGSGPHTKQKGILFSEDVWS